MLVKLLKLLHLYRPARAIKDWLGFINPVAYQQQRKMLKFYFQFIQPGDLCFDVGANLGNRTEIFLQLGATVVAVEPQEKCYQHLAKKYNYNPLVTLVGQALGSQSGEGEIMISEAHTLSSMSPEWISGVKNSGRFADYQWQKKVKVKITTLDKLITQYGQPVFCKIDVEGFEFEVLKGLSRPIKAISFEFTPEFLEPTIKAINHLAGLGSVKFNYSIGESMNLTLANWVGAEEICQLLAAVDQTIFGDIYARFND
ncbi:MAG: FkbM family methyltransferase [Patescibacteria group bacterium]|jgi:FkbM family methyltransferase